MPAGAGCIMAPFAGPVAFNPSRQRNPLPVLTALAFVALAGLGTTAVVVARRRERDWGRLRCAQDIPVVGVTKEWEGDWWAERGRKRYQQARRAGAVTAEQIATKIIDLEISGGKTSSLLSQCKKQFPPHDLTHPRNKELWEGLMDNVRAEMDRERGAAA